MPWELTWNKWKLPSANCAVSCVVGSKVLAELANSKGLPAVKVFALEGHGALDAPHSTELLNAPKSGSAQFGEKKYKKRCFLDSFPKYIKPPAPP